MPMWCLWCVTQMWRCAVVWLVINSALAQTDSTCPPGCYCYRVSREDDILIQCPENSITQVPSPDEITNITFLNLSLHIINTIPQNAFSNYSSLLEVHLSENLILSIDELAFKEVKTLIIVNLSKNRLSYLHPDTFLTTTVLESLDLRRNPLGENTPPTLPLLNSPSLKTLNLSSCKISKLAEQSFVNLPNLVHLDLSDNSLTQLSIETLSPLSQQFIVNLNHNPWVCAAQEFKDLVVWLITEQHFPSLQPSIQCPEIQERKNSMFNRGNCPKSCYCVPYESVAYVNVVCSKRGLLEVPHPRTLISAKVLDLSENNLHILKNNSFSENYDVEELYLNNNLISYIFERAFHSLTSLKIVDLSDNSFKHISPQMFENNIKLTKLVLRGNPLGLTLSSFGPLLVSSSLMWLDLSYSGLSHFTKESFQELTTLKRLDLDHNLFTIIPVLTLKPLISAHVKVNLSDNPWHCDTNFINLLKSLEHSLVSFGSVDCVKLQEERINTTIIKSNPAITPDAVGESGVVQDDMVIMIGLIISGFLITGILVLIGVIIAIRLYQRTFKRDRQEDIYEEIAQYQ